MFDAEDFERITVSTTPVSLPLNKIKPTPPKLPRNQAVITLEKARVRIKLHGEDPTGDEGLLFLPIQTITISGINNLTGFRAIRASGETQNAILNVQYMRG